jgi:2-amino-4-hydroxy-6-hydroxymethyldihydropteridine diphosphokinase
LVTCAIALGSNLGDRHAHLDFAVSRLSTILEQLKPSHRYETNAVGVPEPQPPYLNAAAVGKTTMTARELLEVLLAVERERHRERPSRHAPRTLDLDLILFGDAVIDEPDLLVPHPRFRERRFVLQPLADVAPDLRDPVTNHTIADLLGRLSPV